MSCDKGDRQNYLPWPVAIDIIDASGSACFDFVGIQSRQMRLIASQAI
jgi:hypothetical protein